MSCAIGMRSRRWRPVWTAAILCGTALFARAGDRVTWDFTLPTLAGDRFVRASKLSGPVLVNFWGCYCPPCVEELPRLQAFATAHPNWTVLLVCTDAPRTARVFLRRHHVTLAALRMGADVAGLMRIAGNRDGSLPFTVVLHDGRILLTHSGGLSVADLSAVAAVGQADKSRR